MGKRVSLKDIAEKVGVSTALVSYVLNGQEKEKRVGADVGARIREAAKELKYQPNHIARSLRKGSTKTIGLIVADIANPFFGQLARVVEDEASKFQFNVIFGSSDEDVRKSAGLIETLLNRQVDGFIIAPAENTEDQIKQLIEQDVPLVLVDRYLNTLTTSYVGLDNYHASFDAVQYMISKGYQKIGFVAYESGLLHMQERIRGYEEGMRANNLGDEIILRKIRYNRIDKDVEKVLFDILNKNKKVDALIFATNALSIAGLYYINKINLKVPNDLAIIGFDGNAAFDFFYSPLTYIKQPIGKMGKESVRMLIKQIEGKDNKKFNQVNLKHKLVERESCG